MQLRAEGIPYSRGKGIFLYVVIVILVLLISILVIDGSRSSSSRKNEPYTIYLMGNGSIYAGQNIGERAGYIVLRNGWTSQPAKNGQSQLTRLAYGPELDIRKDAIIAYEQVDSNLPQGTGLLDILSGKTTVGPPSISSPQAGQGRGSTYQPPPEPGHGKKP